MKPSIIIDNKEIALSEYGNAVYKKVIVVGKESSIPISISYINPNNGQLMSVFKSINYSVFQPTRK